MNYMHIFKRKVIQPKKISKAMHEHIDYASVESYQLEGTRLKDLKAIPTAEEVRKEYPVSKHSQDVILESRREIGNIIHHEDDRLVVIVGPCSIHDPVAALEYAKLLLATKEKHKGELMIVMRTYFEKPRTTVGWKGLINDPYLDGSFDIAKGLCIARKLLCDITEMGLPVSVELLDTISPRYLTDLISWGAIGARTTESQLHRELASSVPFPVGFKNGTDGNLGVAIDGMGAGSNPHRFLSLDYRGNVCIANTMGNEDCHVILRGGKNGPNYTSEYVKEAKFQLQKADMNNCIMIDCSHGNSNKDHKNQPKVAESVAEQVESGEDALIGVMIESNLKEGKQSCKKGDALEYGVSITDACIDWESTELALDRLALAVKNRRGRKDC